MSNFMCFYEKNRAIKALKYLRSKYGKLYDFDMVVIEGLYIINFYCTL